MVSDRYTPAFSIDILESLDSLLNYMKARHSKVFVAMFVIKYPAGTHSLYPHDNSLLSKLLEGVTKFHDRHGCDLKYLWVREQSSTGQVHYHVMLLLNGNMVQKAHGLLVGMAVRWQRALGIEHGQGLVHLCSSGHPGNPYGGVMIRRDDPRSQDVYESCYTWGSYLAKCATKGNAPAFVNEFGCSRVG